MYRIYTASFLLAFCVLFDAYRAAQSDCPYYVPYAVNDTDLPYECDSCFELESYKGYCRKPCPEFYQRVSPTTCIPLVGRTYKLDNGLCPEGSHENEHGSCTVPDIVSLDYAVSECKLSKASPYYYEAPYPDFEFMVLAEECK